MTEIIGVRFKTAGKVYYFSPAGLDIKMGDDVIVETARGVECGEVVLAKREVKDEELAAPLKPVIRIANERDYKIIEQNKKKETITHPYLKEKVEWGMVPYVQAMLLARYLRGDLDGYPVFLWK